MDSSERDDEHTCELKSSREEAERVATVLQRRGWEIYPEKVPLRGQWGFYCVQTTKNDDGTFEKREHSVRWNIFGTELMPVVIDAVGEPDILSFLWQHTCHESFDFFEYGDGDVGFVCYCRGERGQSLVLRIGTEIEEDLTENTYEMLYFYSDQNDLEGLEDT